jgi:hypothetical protein
MDCYIVGGGPSLKGFDWDRLKGKFVIAINRAYETCPDAQILYFTDPPFWKQHSEAMLRHGGLLIRGAVGVRNEPKPARLILYNLKSKDGFHTEAGCLAHGQNSGYACINLAAGHLHFKRIHLLGFDLNWKGQDSHWHSGHPRVDKPNAMQSWAKNYDNLLLPLKNLGVEVINYSPDSMITAFPKKDLSCLP